VDSPPNRSHLLTSPFAVRVCEGVSLEPFAVTKAQAYRLVGQTKLVQRWLYWTRQSQPWLVIAREGARKPTLIDLASLKHAYSRYLAGEEPPPLPSELKQKKQRRESRRVDSVLLE
jgi:hypothetical protein